MQHGDRAIGKIAKSFAIGVVTTQSTICDSASVTSGRQSETGARPLGGSAGASSEQTEQWSPLGPNVRHERRAKGREAAFGTSARWRG